MKIQLLLNKKGITLIELLVVLVISGLIVAGIYRVFIAQTRAYTVQDQVVEVQQNIRNAMELLLRDLRMAGFDDDNPNSPITIANPIVYPVTASSVTVIYEHYNTTTLQYETHTVFYSRDVVNSTLDRQLTINNVAGPLEHILENVDALNLTYGVDTNDDGTIDNWLAAGVVGTARVVAIRILLTAKPDQTNPDVQTMVSPRTLDSTVTLRNLSLIRFN
jgi:type IV pilus assembly protein PilW